MQMADDLKKLLDILPTEIRSSLEQHLQRDNLACSGRSPAL